MKLKNIIDENFQDYKKPSMMIATYKCNWKCCVEAGIDITVCQNSESASQNNVEVSIESLTRRYLSNPITKAIVIGGLEPFLQFDEVLNFVKGFREKSNDDIVIYTGYYPLEIRKELIKLKQYTNIIIKFGRYIPKSESRFDEVLGINLISKNQYALKIS